MFVEVKIVKQMPTQTQGRKPTVAIITSKYYEKLAVDSMMEDKTTFVRYKTEGRITFVFFFCKFRANCYHLFVVMPVAPSHFIVCVVD